MRAVTRPVLRSVRAAGRRANSSSSAPNPVQNEQVQKAVEQAQKVYAQGSAAVQKFAGPVGDRVGSALGCELFVCGSRIEWRDWVWGRDAFPGSGLE